MSRTIGPFRRIDGREILTIEGARERVGVTRRTIYNWIEGGKVQYVRTASGSIRIFADTLYRPPQRDRSEG